MARDHRRLGRPAEALALAEQAIAMDPPGDAYALGISCEAHLLLGQYKLAIADCERAKGLSPGDVGVNFYLAAAYALQGDTAKAEALRVYPKFIITAVKKLWSLNPDYLRLAERHIYSGLRKAGLPEQ